MCRSQFLADPIENKNQQLDFAFHDNDMQIAQMVWENLICVSSVRLMRKALIAEVALSALWDRRSLALKTELLSISAQIPYSQASKQQR